MTRARARRGSWQPVVKVPLHSEMAASSVRRGAFTTGSWLLIAGMVLIAPPRLDAHDIGTTQVDLVITAGGSVTASLDVDPETLHRRLELEAGRLPEPVDPAELTTRIAGRGETFLRAITLEADGARVALDFLYSPGSDSPGQSGAPTGRVLLTGRVPADARAITWRYALPLGSYALRVKQPGRAAEQVHWLVGGRTSEPLILAADEPSLPAVVREYVVLGFVHILPRGLDHILFVLSLFLLSPAWRPLLAQVSAFTLAHSVTLGLSVLGVVSLSGAIVEPLIAASIAWVAIENIWQPSLSRVRLAVVFAFGLLHGLGFAGVLSELGLPPAALLPALLAFNVGVELGQLAVIAAAFALTAVALRSARYREWVVIPASAAIAMVGAYWTVERLLSR